MGHWLSPAAPGSPMVMQNPNGSRPAVGHTDAHDYDTGVAPSARPSAAGPRRRELPELAMVTVVGKLPEPLREAAATVSVITAEQIEMAVAFDLQDALRHEPGISVGRDPHRFGSGAVNVRGLGGNRVLVETDGVPAAKTFATGSYSNAGRQFADLELVRRIELLRGPASALYGSDAIAGVVAITTMDPADLLEPGARFAARARAGYAGDDQSVMAGLTVATRQGPFEALLAWTRREGDEFDNNSGRPAANPRQSTADALLARAAFDGFGQPVRLTWLEPAARAHRRGLARTVRRPLRKHNFHARR